MKVISDTALKHLREEVERVFGGPLTRRSDYDRLASVILAQTHKMLSGTTLRRCWGYQNDQPGTPSRTTLDVLSQYAGYTNWTVFCLEAEAGEDIAICNSQQLHAQDLSIGDVVRLGWNPDKTVALRYEGAEEFVVLESNGKLKVGSRFRCAQIIENLSMILTDANGQSYICGCKHGVSFVRENEDSCKKL